MIRGKPKFLKIRHLCYMHRQRHCVRTTLFNYSAMKQDVTLYRLSNRALL